MKKYCLTDCFKRKMSAVWVNTVQVFVAILFVAILGALVGLLSYALGYLAHVWEFALDIPTLDLGIILLLSILVGSYAL